jgi:hypothetical protein
MRTRKRERHFFKQEKNVDEQYAIAKQLATEVVERSYPPEDVSTLAFFQKESMDNLVML